MIRILSIGAALLLAACGTDTIVRNGPQALSPSGGAARTMAVAQPASGPSLTTMQDQTVVIVDPQAGQMVTAPVDLVADPTTNRGVATDDGATAGSNLFYGLRAASMLLR